MDEWELRERVIDQFDIYDLVELLELTTEDMIDIFDVLQYDDFRKLIIDRLR